MPLRRGYLLFRADLDFRYLQSQWREHLGIEITWRTFEINDFMERLAVHTPDLYIWGWEADYPDPDSFLRVGQHSSYHTWHNEQYEQLLEAARRINDPVERLKFYQAADRLLIQEAGSMPLYYDATAFPDQTLGEAISHFAVKRILLERRDHRASIRSTWATGQFVNDWHNTPKPLSPRC